MVLEVPSKKNMVIIEKISIDAVQMFGPSFPLILVDYILNDIWRKILYRGYIKNPQILGRTPSTQTVWESMQGLLFGKGSLF